MPACVSEGVSCSIFESLVPSEASVLATMLLRHGSHAPNVGQHVTLSLYNIWQLHMGSGTCECLAEVAH